MRFNRLVAAILAVMLCNAGLAPCGRRPNRYARHR